MEKRIGTIRKYRDKATMLEKQMVVDDRSLAEVVSYIYNYLEHVQYYNTSNERDGNFQQLVKGDPVFFLIPVLNISTDELAGWVKMNDDELEEKRDEISQYLEKLSMRIRNWLASMEVHHFDKLYQQMGSGEKSFTDPVKNALADIDQLQKSDGKSFREICDSYYRMLINNKSLIKEKLNDILLQSEHHRPHAAMYLTFAYLLQDLQGNINRIPERHLEYYYEKVLGQINNSGKPVMTTICLEVLPTAQNFLLEKGTRFSAGKIMGSKEEVIFKTMYPIVINNLRLTQLKTLLFARNPNLKYGTTNPLVTSISLQDMIVNGKPINAHKDWYSFGANKAFYKKVTLKESQVVQMGFEIASRALFLEEGSRDITITFNLEDSTEDPNLWQLLQQIASRYGESINVVFLRIFSDGFKVQYSNGQLGWVELSAYTVDAYPERNAFSFELKIGKMMPPVSPLKGKDQPIIKFLLNENAPVFVYSFLSGATLRSLEVKAAVSGVKNLSVYNNIGKMPTEKPFKLFGPLAPQGSFLMVGKTELAFKNVDQLEMVIDWANLPKNGDDFGTYYEGYSENIANDSFKVSSWVLKEKSWYKVGSEVSLFDEGTAYTAEGYKAEKLLPQSHLGFTNIPDSNFLETPKNIRNLLFDINTSEGFYKIYLEQPEPGFGVETYNKLLLENARTSNGMLNWERVNKPFIPEVKSISINYSCSDEIVLDSDLLNDRGSLNTGTYSHITPFETKVAASNDVINARGILADYNNEAYFMIGIEGVKQPISLPVYFYLHHSTTSSLLRPSGINWEYYYKGQWWDFKRDEITTDGTSGFLRSGIIEFKINRFQPKDSIFWIRAVISEQAEHYPIVKGVFLNSVMVQEDKQNLDLIGKKVMAGSIVKVKDNYPQIKGVIQPADSFGGERISTKGEFYARISERIRTRNRAVTAKDFEDLLLNNFDAVSAVRCIRANIKGKQSAGELTIVALRRGWNFRKRLYFSVGMLRYMESFLQKHSSPYLKPKVINPRVENLLVNCIVDFDPNGNAGENYRKFNDEITRYLFSFSDIEHGVGGIGGKLDISVLRAYLIKLPFVEYIKYLTVERISRDDNGKYSVKVYKDCPIETSVPWAILLPVQKHRIIVEANDQPVTDQKLEIGIEELRVGEDLVLDTISDEYETSDNLEDKHHDHMHTDEYDVHETGEDDNDAVIVIKD